MCLVRDINIYELRPPITGENVVLMDLIRAFAVRKSDRVLLNTPWAIKLLQHMFVSDPESDSM